MSLATHVQCTMAAYSKYNSYGLSKYGTLKNRYKAGFQHYGAFLLCRNVKFCMRVYYFDFEPFPILYNRGDRLGLFSTPKDRYLFYNDDERTFNTAVSIPFLNHKHNHLVTTIMTTTTSSHPTIKGKFCLAKVHSI
jgi:hypothetical protein